LCSAHDTTRVKAVVSDEVRCKCLKKTGEQCGMKKRSDGDYCKRHASESSSADLSEEVVVSEGEAETSGDWSAEV